MVDAVPPVIAASLWALAVTAVAFLPMRLQVVPGLGLLLAAPALIWWLAAAVGPLAAGAGVLAVLSTFRRPLGALLRRLARTGGDAPR